MLTHKLLLPGARPRHGVPAGLASRHLSDHLRLEAVVAEGSGDRERVGVVLQGFDDSAYRAAAVEAIQLAKSAGIRQTARNVAHQYFDLDTVGGQRYFDVYRKLVQHSVVTERGSVTSNVVNLDSF